MDPMRFLQGLLMASGKLEDWRDGPFVEVPLPIPSAVLASFTRELERLRELGLLKGDTDILELFITTLRTFILSGMAAEGEDVIEALFGGKKDEK